LTEEGKGWGISSQIDYLDVSFSIGIGLHQLFWSKHCKTTKIVAHFTAWQICPAVSVDIGINVHRLGLGVGLLLLILCIEATLDV
jgi:hypothetical protein